MTHATKGGHVVTVMSYQAHRGEHNDARPMLGIARHCERWMLYRHCGSILQYSYCILGSLTNTKCRMPRCQSERSCAKTMKCTARCITPYCSLWRELHKETRDYAASARSPSRPKHVVSPLEAYLRRKAVGLGYPKTTLPTRTRIRSLRCL
jgi:hypothetical protein